MRGSALLFVAAWIFVSTDSDAALRHVPSDHATLTAALAAAQAGDTVVVAPGTYAPSTNGEVFPLVVPDGVHLLGAGMGASVLDAEGTASVVRIVGTGGGQRVAGFTITGGNAQRGGGVQIEAGSPEIAHNLITLNGALNRGSGINVQGNATPWIHHNVVWQNFDLDLLHVGDPHGIQCGIDSAGVIEHNLVGRTDSNGLLTQEQAAPTIRHNIFFDNGIDGLRGRGICNFGAPATVIAHNLFFANSISALVMRDAQGVIRNMSAQEADAEFSDDLLYGNLDGDPLLRDVEMLDFALLPGSPAIDAGDPTVATDPDGSAPDLGPFAYLAQVGAVAPRSLAIEMHGNAPNPFNPATEIRFTVHVPAHVRVDVVDARGRAVRDLVTTTFAAGVHAVRWDGTDHRGDPVASGVYFARATSATASAIAPMVLVR